MSKGNGSAISHSDRVHQAQGMVSVQAACSMDDALALIRSRAAVSGQTVEQIADAVVDRTLRFD